MYLSGSHQCPIEFKKNVIYFALRPTSSNFAAMNRIIITLYTLILAAAVHAQTECEDSCSHIHGIDLSHYQGNVFWEAIGENAKMAYVYLKATEGGDNIDDKYRRNIPEVL